MKTNKIRVGVNGYGVIGKRVADAVRVQPDMELAGVSDIISDYRIKVAVELDIPIYASLPEKESEMKDAGLPVAGVLENLVGNVDVMVDCTPKGIAAKNLARYKSAGVKAIVQGGEGHSVTEHSFVAQANYSTAIGRDATRVVSCNSTLELMRDLGRPRGDMWEVALWEDVLTVNGAECYFTYQVDNQSIVIPENIDAIRALSGVVRDGQESIQMTNEALGIKRYFIDQMKKSS
ncbi:MAG: type II glyceraldehyde-3-phosphate dehydrogenase [Gallionella sp.]|nr:type II glyceraldehyde-3-phosphate dehydrogenase [Gallionella sp.]